MSVLAKLLEGHHHVTSEAAEYTYSLVKEGILADILTKIGAPFDARDIALYTHPLLALYHIVSSCN
jgi:hypothetical protein